MVAIGKHWDDYSTDRILYVQGLPPDSEKDIIKPNSQSTWYTYTRNDPGSLYPV